ncbi:MAG: hypothetical protein KKC96_00760 [Nanoarchaeota archaeon]|nr:hypothetical protein [Nanoarchaeota archaeon]
MAKLEFDSEGRFIGVDGIKPKPKNKPFGTFKPRPAIFSKQVYSDNQSPRTIDGKLHESKKRIFPQEKRELLTSKSFETPFEKIDNSQDTKFWSLYKDGKRMDPLKFSNGKTQEDVVEEVVNLVKAGKKIIFLHGVCGTGKSAIALNIARALGRAAVVVPVKNLQSQYQRDYMGRMMLVKPSGEKLKISMITGRGNHDSIFKPGVSCADSSLPDTIQITEKNFRKLREYYQDNPLIKNKSLSDISQLRRVSIAPTNPYWSPVVNSKYQMNLPDAVKKSYRGLNDQNFIFYHRKKGCSYYDQYESYLTSDVIIFNSAKYKIETSLDRKPATEIDIIDESDEFLDSFSSQNELNLTRLKNSLAAFYSEDDNALDIANKTNELIKLEERNKRATGVDENKVFPLGETNLGKILELLLKDSALESENYFEDSSSDYIIKAVEVAKEFIDFLKDTYLTYRYYEENLYVNLVTTNLSKRLEEVLNKNKAFVFMSGTLHSKSVLENVFGITDYDIVEAETIPPGTIEIQMTGKEFDCKYSSFSSGNATREDYLNALAVSISKAERPTLVHINAFSDLPEKSEKENFNIKNIMSRENLLEIQLGDRTGRVIQEFKDKEFDLLYSTKCSRGVDFPGEQCNSIIFTKFPNPNPRDIFWKILQKTHPSYFWDFYKDKARREFLQRLYRALRSKNDHVFVLSPDSRVLDAVREIQKNLITKT